jgi:hypothetical protein
VKNNPDKPWNYSWLSEYKIKNKEKENIRKNIKKYVIKIENWWLKIMYKPNSNYVINTLKP